jgi:hypothetical protein
MHDGPDNVSNQEQGQLMRKIFKFKEKFTKLGQNRLIFWIETKPTSKDTGNSQNNVNPLVKEYQYGRPRAQKS